MKEVAGETFTFVGSVGIDAFAVETRDRFTFVNICTKMEENNN